MAELSNFATLTILSRTDGNETSMGYVYAMLYTKSMPLCIHIGVGFLRCPFSEEGNAKA